MVLPGMACGFPQGASLFRCLRGFALQALLLTGMAGLSGAVHAIENYPPPATTSAPVTKKLLVVIYGPILADQQKLHVAKGWNDPRALVPGIVDTLRTASGGYLNYQVVDIVERNEWPRLVNGFFYDESSYNVCLASEPRGAPDCDRTDFDYAKMFGDLGLVSRVNSGEVDDIFIYNAPWFGPDEYAFRIPGDVMPYNTPENLWLYQNRQKNIPALSRSIAIMGFTYDREIEDALHSYGHRVEGTLALTLGRGFWSGCRGHAYLGPSDFDHFTCSEKDAKGSVVGVAGAGSVHVPPNGLDDYDYGNDTRSVTHAAYSWLNYPFTVKTTSTGDCNIWGCTGLGYMKWWLSRLPNREGKAANGNFANWWKYVADYDRAIAATDFPLEARIMSPTANATVTGIIAVTNMSTNMRTSKVELYVDGTLRATSNGRASSMSWNTREVSTGTVHNLAIRVYDASGASVLSQPVPVMVDNAPPVISQVNVSGIGPQSATVAWQTNLPTGHIVRYGPSLPYTFATIAYPGGITTHVTVLTGLAPDTLYHYQIDSWNENGHAVTSDLAFRTPPSLPISSVQVIDGGSYASSVAFDTAESTRTFIEYGTGSGAYTGRTTYTSTSATHHVIALTGLTPNTRYYYRIRAQTDSGADLVSREFVLMTPPNSLPNGSFETAGGWSRASTHVLDANRAHGGGTSLRSDYRSNGGPGVSSLTSAIAVLPHRLYRVSAWIFNGSLDGKAYVDLNDIPGEVTLPSTKAITWEYVSALWDSGFNTSVNVRLVTDGAINGNVWFDDVSLSLENPVINSSFVWADGGNVSNALGWTEAPSHKRDWRVLQSEGWSLHSTYRSAGGAGVASESATIAVQPNTRYLVSGWIYKAATQGNAYIDAYRTPTVFTLPATVSGQWQYVQGIWFSGANTSLTLRCVTDGAINGDVWFDEIRIVRMLSQN